MKKIYTFDTTLRDGMQAEKISFTVEDKLKTVKYLDSLGVDFIEAGNPSSNIKDAEFFEKVKGLELTHSRLVAFGSTCKAGGSAESDTGLRKLLLADTDAVAIFGKAWELHITEVLGTTAEENLNMIKNSVEFLKKNGRYVIFDAEHFFDGYKDNPDYAMSVLIAAQTAGADCVVLCDTNGGSFPLEVYDIVETVTKKLEIPVGIHCHNDSGMAVSCSITAVQAGACHVQGTLNGIGERCGNANLATIIANLQLKSDYTLIPPENLCKLTEISRSVADISNISVSGLPYVSRGAFSHKAGMHIDAVLKNPASFEHINPSAVGNSRNILVSEISGKSAILPALRKIVPDADKNSPQTAAVLKKLKDLEFLGYQYEVANASLDLVIRKTLGLYKPFFEVTQFKVLVEQGSRAAGYASAIVKVMVDGREEITAADSSGPIHAIDTALRKALNVFYPQLLETQLIDYKVRVLNSEAAAGATVRVLIETADSEDSWITVGVSTDVIEASRQALIDSIEYKLIKDRKD